MEYRILSALLLLLMLSGCGRMVFPGGDESKQSTWRGGTDTHHQVAKGETLYSIAYRYGVEYRTLAQWNKIKSPYRIFIGQQLALKPQIKHQVKKGDTLYSIAFRYGIDYRSLAKVNKIKAPFQILVGQQLTIIPQANISPVETQKKGVQQSTKVIKRPQKVVTSKRNTTQSGSTKSSTYNSNRKVYWRWPVKGKLVTTFSPKDHRKGVDIRGKVGKTIVAADAGDVVYSGNGLLGYGNLIIIRHNSSYLSAYGHNRKLLVKEGAKVKKGEKIAEMGRTRKKGAVLHFEIRRNGQPVNPLRYLPKS